MVRMWRKSTFLSHEAYSLKSRTFRKKTVNRRQGVVESCLLSIPRGAALYIESRKTPWCCSKKTHTITSLQISSAEILTAEKSLSRSEPKAYMTTGGDRVSLDVIGVAAEVGMTIYVCEQLDLPMKTGRHSSSPAGLEYYPKRKRTSATFSWNDLCQPENVQTDMAAETFSSSYHRALGEYLQWKTDDQRSLHIEFLSEAHSLAVTYTLSCCGPACLDLVQTLLAVGANPMVQVQPQPYGTSIGTSQHCWEKWLEFLLDLRTCYMNTNGRSGGLMLRHRDVDVQITLKAVFDTTKTLLVKGVDINYKLRRRSYSDFLKRRNTRQQDSSFTMTPSAMYIL